MLDNQTYADASIWIQMLVYGYNIHYKVRCGKLNTTWKRVLVNAKGLYISGENRNTEQRTKRIKDMTSNP